MARQAEANRRSVQEARDSGKFPERLSVSVRPAPFDARAWKANPQAYLDVIEPGRVYQVAEPGPSVKRMEVVGEPFVHVPEATPATLGVQVEPGAAVTFTAFGSTGAFDNTLTTISVKADRKGIARVIFTPAPGVTGSVRILAGSPSTSGQTTFLVGVKPEE